MQQYELYLQRVQFEAGWETEMPEEPGIDISAVVNIISRAGHCSRSSR
jgi:predicted molibdopterin-dependent oxidoreductase YjgC